MPKYQETIDELVEDVVETQEVAQRGQREVAEQIQQKESDTRDFVARYFTRSFVFLAAIIIVGVPLYNAAIADNMNFESMRLDLADLLQAFSALFGPILGFVLGYYFKSREK